jgi:hypothetical protein
MPTMPHRDAGWRMDPPVSVPSEAGTASGGDAGRRAAAGASRDPRRIPGVFGDRKAEFSVDEPMANSSMFALPRMMAPARLSLVDAVRVVDRHEALQDFGSAGRRHADRGQDVLDDDGHAPQGPLCVRALRVHVLAWARASSPATCSRASSRGSVAAMRSRQEATAVLGGDLARAQEVADLGQGMMEKL